MIAPPRPACANGAWASLLRVLAVACIAGAHVSAAPASIAASEDSFGSLGPGGYADYPLDVDEPPRPEEMELEAMQPEPPEDPVDGLPPPPAPGPADLPAGEGDLRLVGRTDLGGGFVGGSLQAFIGGSFGSVCDFQFGPPDADVACRQLGFVGGSTGSLVIIDLERSEEILAPFVLEALNCTGTEERLVDCPGITEGAYNDYIYLYQFAGDSTGTCDPLEGTLATVVCGTLTGPADGDIRLAPVEGPEAGNAAYGRLEIFSGGGWIPVCDSTAATDRFRTSEVLPEAAARVACRQLGFAGGEKAVAGTVSEAGGLGFSTVRSVPLLPPGASCTGDEEALAACSGGGPGGTTADQCGSFRPSTLALVCFNSTDLDTGTDGSLRLADGQAGPGYEYGRLDIFLRGLWRAVCDEDRFTPDAAQVACAALGFGGGAALQFRQARKQVLGSTLPVGLTRVDCAGDEPSLLQCSSVSSYPEITFRRNAGATFARCTRLNSVTLGDDVTTATASDARTTDSTVLACGDTSGDCPDQMASQGSVRLRGGFGTPCDPVHTGFVEILNSGEWGAICDGNNPSSARADVLADVVCRQLGFPHGTVVQANIPFNRSETSFAPGDEEADELQDRFWLNANQARCLGPEEQVVDCDLGSGFRNNNSGCRNNPTRLTVACRTFAVPEALEAVTTPGAEEGDLRLVEQSTVDNWVQGGLELFLDGTWGQVCSSSAGFSGSDVDVACRQLGFSGGAVAPNKPADSFRPIRRNNFSPPQLRADVFPEVALSGGPGCTGSEQRLLDCVGGDLGALASQDAAACYEGSYDYFDETSPRLIIACVAEAEAGVEGSLRLTTFGDDDIDNDPEAGVGILEVFHAGAWGTVCNGDPRFIEADDGSAYSAPFLDASLTQAAAQVACRQLGFTGGEFRGIERRPFEEMPLRPSWLADLPCTAGTDTSISDCGALDFGNTSSCGFPQRLLCTDGPPGTAFLTPRLVAGEADPGGAWAYGRLEVFDGLAFVTVSDAKGRQELGRRGAQVACRTLGFATGGQALAGQDSVLPLLEGAGRDGAVGNIICRGDEAVLSDCPFRAYTYDYDNYARVPEDAAVALVCYRLYTSWLMLQGRA